MKRAGRKSVAQTIAPKEDRIYGSTTNLKGSASSEESAESIKFSEKVMNVLIKKQKEFNNENPTKKVSIDTIKAVFRRGLGAYSKTHRPTITGGVPNSRTAWGFARVNKFLEKRSGKEVKKAYVQDDDLLKKYHLGGDMSKHLAPNGKPSNLTHEQWHLVRTPEFKAWFGDWENSPETSSKVVDENGEPLVVYHGTKSFDIEIFDRSKSNKVSSGLKEYGTYFTDNLKLAEAYKNWSELTDESKNDINRQISKWQEVQDKSRSSKDYEFAEQEIKKLKQIKEGKIYSVFLNLKKIKVFDAQGKTYNDAWNNLRVKADYKIATNRDAMQFLKYGEFGVGKVDGIKAENIVDAFVQTEELKKELLSDVYLVFDNRNIKSADGTNTTFDSSNPDIRYAKGGLIAPNGNKSNLNAEQYKLVRTKAFKDWFGDWEKDPENASKVVDENGEPLVVYHGGNNDFNRFEFDLIGTTTDKGWYGYGFYFSATELYASLYGSVKTYFINIRNMFDCNKNNPLYGGGKEVTEYYIQKGYDGASNTFGVDKNRHEYCVFFKFPNNIKLADGTNTTFDGNNPDIRFAQGGIIEVVLNEGNGVTINKLYSEWSAIKNQKQQEAWQKKVRNAKFGTYGTIGLLETLEKFNFMESNKVNGVLKHDFIEEIKDALNSYAEGGTTPKFGAVENTPYKGWSEEKVMSYDFPELYEIAEHHKMGYKTIRNEFIKGIFVEREHTSDWGMSAHVSMQHLFENPKYYTILQSLGL